jgi:integrase
MKGERDQDVSVDQKRGEYGAGRIWKIGNRWWIQWYVNGKQMRESSKSTTKAVAEKLLKRRIGEAEAGLTPDLHARRLRYEEMRDALFADYRNNGHKSLERRADGSERICGVMPLDEMFAKHRAGNITTAKIREFIGKRKADGIPNATINRSLAALRRMFYLALEDKLIRFDDIPHFPMLAEDNVRKGFLDHDQFIRLRDALAEHVRPIFTTGYYTGMRLGELAGLRWHQVKLRDRQILLNPGETKNKEPRIVPLNSELLAVLEMELAKRNEKAPNCQWVFSRDGESVGCFRKAWTNACVRAGLGRWIYVCKSKDCGHQSDSKTKACPKCKGKTRRAYQGLIFHDLRRTGVRNLMRSGVSQTVAMRISGHRTLSVFQRYDITDERDLTEAARKQDAYFAEQKAKIQAERHDSPQPQLVQ